VLSDLLVQIISKKSQFFHYLLEDLQRLKHGYSMEFVRASSYDGTSTTGNVLVSGGLRMEDLNQRHVIVVEDIVDTGTTLSHLLPLLQEKAQPKSLAICTLLEKRLIEKAKVKPKYTGFSIPDHFIVGFGLDYNELYRDVPDIWVISQAGIDFDGTTLHV
jgi:hypoxanthine phosphoribosyltransferase